MPWSTPGNTPLTAIPAMTEAAGLSCQDIVALQMAQMPYIPRRSVPWHYPQDMPWNTALSIRATPVLIAAKQALCDLGLPSPDRPRVDVLLSLIARWRGLGLEPLVLGDKSLMLGHGKESLQGLMGVGARICLMPDVRPVWQTITSLTSSMVLLHPVSRPLARRSGLLMLLREAGRRKIWTYAESVRDSLRPGTRAACGWPVLLGQSTVRGLASARLDWHKDVAPHLPTFDNADERCVLTFDETFTLADMPDETWLPPESALSLLRALDIPERGVRHALAVGLVARAFAQRGRLRGMQLTPDLAFASGLVHDIAKGNHRHEMVGGLWLSYLGLTTMSRNIRDHRDLTIPERAPVTERELVYMADKYCFGPRFVPLVDRFGQKKDLYRAQERAVAAIERRLRHARRLEARLTCELGVSPEDIARETLAGASPCVHTAHPYKETL